MNSTMGTRLYQIQEAAGKRAADVVGYVMLAVYAALALIFVGTGILLAYDWIF